MARHSVGRPVGVALATCVALSLLFLPREANACGVDFQFVPTSHLQIVIWVEDAQGNFVDTVFITDAVGRYGLGNRPGILEFNSEFLWPYGRRESTFPVWAHRHGVEYPKLVFQDEDDDDLSHDFFQSTADPYYCQPFHVTDADLQKSIDMGSCATAAFTDKGMFHPTEKSLYPPRNDLTAIDPQRDHPDTAMFAELNQLDAVTRATPPGGMPYAVRWVPRGLPDGDYVAWIEVSKEFDPNASHDYPSPTLPAWGDYGRKYRGQPSVVWKVPFRLGEPGRNYQTLDYAGYGDPAGLSGTLNPPDGTITEGMEGSGAGRLAVALSEAGPYRFRVRVLPREDNDEIAPGMPEGLVATGVGATSARFEFSAPGDDGTGGGTVASYEIRYLAGTPMTAQNFVTQGKAAQVRLDPVAAGGVQSFELTGLLPETSYWVGVRALDECTNAGPISIVNIVTTPLEAPSVGCGCRAGGRATGGVAGALAWVAGLGVAWAWRRLARRRSVG